jgi:RNA polymerase sigma factor (sigma-70 family)
MIKTKKGAKMIDELEALVPTIRRFAFSLTGSMHDADDLLQNTIERILTKGVPEDVHLTKWAFRICRNLWIDEHRSRKVRQDATQKPELQQNQITDGEQTMTNQVTIEQVNKAMANLPDEQRSIISLVAVEGLTYREVAETLGIPIGTVMSRLSRARITLSDWFHSNQQGVTI